MNLFIGPAVNGIGVIAAGILGSTAKKSSRNAWEKRS